MVVPATMQPDGDVEAVLIRYLRARKCALRLCHCCRAGLTVSSHPSCCFHGVPSGFQGDRRSCAIGPCAIAVQVQR
jgi:hypothetical protein